MQVVVEEGIILLTKIHHTPAEQAKSGIGPVNPDECYEEIHEVLVKQTF